VGGAIFFCYNDYRTHVGDRGVGALQQRVHGVVDVYGAQKPSYAILREESSPIESLKIRNGLKRFHIIVKTRATLPSYTFRGYKVRGVFYGQGDIPVEAKEADLAEIEPGNSDEVELLFTAADAPRRVCFELVRSTGFPACAFEWTPSVFPPI